MYSLVFFALPFCYLRARQTRSNIYSFIYAAQQYAPYNLRVLHVV